MHARGEAGVQSHGLNTPGCSSSQINAHTRIPQHVRLPGRGGQAAQPREKSQESRRCKTERASFECNNRWHRPGDDLKKSWGCAANLVLFLLYYWSSEFLSLCHTLEHDACLAKHALTARQWIMTPAAGNRRHTRHNGRWGKSGRWYQAFGPVIITGFLSSLNDNSYFGNMYIYTCKSCCTWTQSHTVINKYLYIYLF